MSQFPSRTGSANKPVVGIPDGTRADLLSIAKYQKGILLGILLSLATTIATLAAPLDLRFWFGLLLYGVGLLNAVFIFLLSTKLFGTIKGIGFAILTIVPFLGLLILLLVNGRATKILKQNGIGVGLLGANLSSIQTP